MAVISAMTSARVRAPTHTHACASSNTGCVLFLICASHTCARATRVFSVTFQFRWMISVEQRPPSEAWHHKAVRKCDLMER